jgi:hypothetical protein
MARRVANHLQVYFAAVLNFKVSETVGKTAVSFLFSEVLLLLLHPAKAAIIRAIIAIISFLTYGIMMFECGLSALGILEDGKSHVEIELTQIL